MRWVWLESCNPVEKIPIIIRYIDNLRVYWPRVNHALKDIELSLVQVSALRNILRRRTRKEAVELIHARVKRLW